jgi:vancomycin resistance protein YoaR
MVSSYSDLKFTNNSGGDLYIRAVADGERLTVQIYGTKLDVTVTRKSEKVKSIPYGVKYIEDKTLTEGEQRIITTGENGLESKGYLCYVKNGELIECKQIRHDVYKPKNSLVAVRSTEASEINRTA